MKMNYNYRVMLKNFYRFFVFVCFFCNHCKCYLSPYPLFFFFFHQVSVLVMCHTRELAFQISKEYERFSKYMSSVKCSVFFGGLPIKKDEDVLKKSCPHIVVGTPGRILALIRNKTLSLKNIKHFVLDECDKMLEQLGESTVKDLDCSSTCSFVSAF